MIGRLLLAGLAALAAVQPANAAWREASTDHFVIYSEQSENSLRDFATRLERFDKAMRFLRRLPDEAGGANRLTVYVVKDTETVQKLHGSKGRSGVAGFYLPRAEGSIAITPRQAGGGGQYDVDADIVLLHEYGHHFMLQNYPGAFPAWLIEGFAEFHSTARFEHDGAVTVGVPAMHRARELAFGETLSAEKMMSSAVGQLSPELRSSLYARGWLLTHLLTFEPARKGQLSAFIRKLNEGASSLDAAKTAFGDLKQLDRDLEAYRNRGSLYSWKLPAKDLAIGPINIRSVSPAEEALMDLRIRSRRGVSPAQAKELLPLVRRAAAPYPNDPFAQATLAEAEFDAGNLAEAEAAADRALAANPKHVDALIYRARAQMESARKSGVTDQSKWTDIRKSILAANRADPTDPEPLILFYRSFMAQRAEPTANAVLGLVTASDAAPQDRMLRMQVAHQMLKDGKIDDARRALRPIAFDPHGGKISEAATSILAKLDQGGTRAAADLSSSLSKSAGSKDEDSSGDGPGK